MTTAKTPKLDPFVSRWTYLTALEPGWFGGCGNRISRDAIDLAQHALIATTDLLGAPGIFPMEDGGVQLEWASPRHVRSVEITPGLVMECFDLRTGRQRSVRTIAALTQFFALALAEAEAA